MEVSQFIENSDKYVLSRLRVEKYMDICNKIESYIYNEFRSLNHKKYTETEYYTKWLYIETYMCMNKINNVENKIDNFLNLDPIFEFKFYRNKKLICQTIQKVFNLTLIDFKDYRTTLFKFYLSKEKIDVLHGLCNLMGCIKA